MMHKIIFFLCIILSTGAHALSFGISPHSIEIYDEGSIALINPNNTTVSFSVQGCSYPYIDVMRSGTIPTEEIRLITIRKNPSESDFVNACTLTISFQNGGHITGGTVDISLKRVPQNVENMFAQQPQTPTEQENTSFPIHIVIVGIALLIVLIIIKFAL